MLLYADEKLNQLSTLATELNQNAQEAKNLLNKSNIQNAIQSSFNTLESNTNTNIQKLQTNLTNTIQSTLDSKTKELEKNNTTKLENTIKSYLTQEKITNLLNIPNLKQDIKQEFLTTQQEAITNTITKEITPTLLPILTKTLSTQLHPKLQENLSQSLETHINNTIEDIHIEELPLTQEQIQDIVTTLLDSKDLQNTLKQEFSKHLNEKLHTNTDLQNALNEIFKESINEFYYAKVEDFKYFLLQTNALFATQVCTLSNTYEIFKNHSLEELELELKHKLDTKRQEYNNKLKDPNAIKRNIYQRI